MDLNAVALLVKVIEYHSFSKASDKTAVPTSTISRKIAELEVALDMQLLERTTRTLRLTENGRIFYEQIKPLIEALDLARLSLMDKNLRVSGTLRLSVPPGIEESIIIPLLASFKKINPETCIKVIATGTNLKFVEDGIDVALRIGELKDSNFIAHSLVQYKHILVASPEYLLDKKIPVHPDELSGHSLISAGNWYGDAQWKFKKNQHKVVYNINESLSLNHYAAIQLAIKSNMGIGEIPSINGFADLKKGSLIQILPRWALSVYGQETVKLSVVYSANRYNSTLIKNFKNFCVTYFSGADDK